MKIRIQLTFSVRREPRPEPVPLEDYRYVDSLVERAEPFPMGFQAVPGREDQELKVKPSVD